MKILGKVEGKEKMQEKTVELTGGDFEDVFFSNFYLQSFGENDSKNGRKGTN